MTHKTLFPGKYTEEPLTDNKTRTSKK